MVMVFDDTLKFTVRQKKAQRDTELESYRQRFGSAPH
jgi:hypothetical protein